MSIALLLVLSLVSTAPPYVVLGLGKTSALQRDLEEASNSGYRVVGAFDGAVVLRKTSGERYVYRIVDAGSVASMEEQMNAAAAAGFRLLPQAVIAHRLLAVMEKRLEAPSVAAQYKVLSFSTDYVMKTAIRRTLSVRLDADAVDARLAEMSIAGYRVAALVTRDLAEGTTDEPVAYGLLGMSVERHQLRQELLVFVEKTRDRPATLGPREAAGRYHVVAASGESQFDEMLNRAAAAGYRFSMAAPNGFPELIAVFERRKSTDERPAYGVLATFKISTLADELTRASRAGWMPHPSGLLDSSGGCTGSGHVLLVLERKPGAAVEALVLATRRVSTLNTELAQAAAAGFELVTAGVACRELLVVLKR